MNLQQPIAPPRARDLRPIPHGPYIRQRSPRSPPRVIHVLTMRYARRHAKYLLENAPQISVFCHRVRQPLYSHAHYCQTWAF